MTFILIAGVVGTLALAITIVVSNGQRKNRRQLRRLKDEVERMTDQLKTEKERDAETRRLKAIEAEKRKIHGRFDSGGC